MYLPELHTDEVEANKKRRKFIRWHYENAVRVLDEHVEEVKHECARGWLDLHCLYAHRLQVKAVKAGTEPTVLWFNGTVRNLAGWKSDQFFERMAKLMHEKPVDRVKEWQYMERQRAGLYFIDEDDIVF